MVLKTGQQCHWVFQGEPQDPVYRGVHCLSDSYSLINVLLFTEFTRVLTEWHTELWIWMETFKVDRMVYKVNLY